MAACASAFLVGTLAIQPMRAAESASENAASAQADETLVAELTELILVGDAARASELLGTAPGGSAGVRVEGFAAPVEQSLVEAVQTFVGKPVSKTMLERLRSAIEAVPTSEAGAQHTARYPRQSIARGRIVVVVSSQQEASTELSRGPDGAGAPAGVVPLLRAGARGRDTSFFLGLDNQLSLRLGDERAYAGARFQGLFDPRSSLGVLVVAALEADVYHGASINHGFAFSEAWKLELGVSASEVELEDGARTTHSTLVKIEPRLSRRFALSGGAWHEARLGMEWRENRVEVTQGAAEREFPLPGYLFQPGWSALLPDRFGRTWLEIELNCNPGWLGSDEDYRDFAASDADYVILKTQVVRTLRLGVWGQLVARGTLQLADQYVPSLDHYYATGLAAVRGYDENSHHAADVWLVSLEHQGPRLVPGAGWWVQPVAFFDAAGFPEAVGEETIAGAGAGLRAGVGKGFTLKLDAARAVSGRAPTDKSGSVHFSLNQRW